MMIRQVMLGVVALLTAGSLALAGLTLWDGGEPGVAAHGGRAGGYTVTLSPVGEVYFPRVPERVAVFDENYVDMLIALGQEHKLVGFARPQNMTTQFYEHIPGFEMDVNLNEVTPFYGGSGAGFDAELLYELDADVHHMDPLRMRSFFGWDQPIIDRITRDVGPFFANRYSRTHGYHGSEPYEYYTLWKLAEKVGQVYGRGERIAALKAIYDGMLERIHAQLPPRDQRPSVGKVDYAGGGTFHVWALNGPGFDSAEYRALGVTDALASISDRAYGHGYGAVDLETLIELDPDILVHNWTLSSEASQRRMAELKALKDDPLAGRLTALRTGRVYPAGTPMQGPIVHLFQLEMAAKQIYPEIFGPFREDHDYPPSEQLFDRERLAAILRGEVEGADREHP